VKEVNLEQNSDDWLIWRQSGIGGSDASTIMGDNPFKSWQDLLEEKLGIKHNETNAAMMRGTRLEDSVREMVEEMYGVSLPAKCFVSSDYSWQRASVDGWSGLFFIEIKCPQTDGPHWKALDNKVPDYYYAQLQHNMMVTKTSNCRYVSYTESENFLHKDKLKVFIVNQDSNYQQALLREEKRFMKELNDLRKDAGMEVL